MLLIFERVCSKRFLAVFRIRLSQNKFSCKLSVAIEVFVVEVSTNCKESCALTACEKIWTVQTFLKEVTVTPLFFGRGDS